MKVIEFEGQNWLEIEPVPLALDTKFPCLVRLIADDSIIGISNLARWESAKLKTIFTATGHTDNYHLTFTPDSLFTDGRWDMFLFEIIATPLVEGSAEWAWQMMLLGNMVIHHKYPWMIDDDLAYSKHDMAGMCHHDWIVFLPKTGWQFYTEPEPKFKVGQYVEFNTPTGKSHGIIISKNTNQGTYDVTELSHYTRSTWVLGDVDITLVKPSEVILNFGNGIKGTVYKSDYPACRFLLTQVNIMGATAIIPFVMLDPETRALVESLLKAQEASHD